MLCINMALKLETHILYHIPNFTLYATLSNVVFLTGGMSLDGVRIESFVWRLRHVCDWLIKTNEKIINRTSRCKRHLWYFFCKKTLVQEGPDKTVWVELKHWGLRKDCWYQAFSVINGYRHIQEQGVEQFVLEKIQVHRDFQGKQY